MIDQGISRVILKIVEQPSQPSKHLIEGIMESELEVKGILDIPNPQKLGIVNRFIDPITEAT